VLGVAAGLAVLAIADRILDPVPLAAGSVWLGGLLGGALPRRRPHAWIAGVVLGLAAGAGVHLSWHVTGRSTPPAEGVALHVAREGLVGLAAGVAALVAGSGAARARR
jgi:hypothetical protein